MKVVQSKSDTGYLNLYFPACGTMLTLLYVISYFGIIACMSKVFFFLGRFDINAKPHYV